MSYRGFVGIDISKKKFDTCVLVPGRAKCFKKSFSNTLAGCQQLLNWLTRQVKVAPGDCLICMEHTGVYTLPLINALSQAKLNFVVESPLRLKRSIGIVRTKSDQADAHTIAFYARNHQSQLRCYQFQGKHWLKLRTLLQYREKLLKTKGQFSTSCNELSEFTEEFVNAEILMDWKVFKQDLEARIKKVEKALKKLVAQDELLKTNFKLLTSITGIGPITAYNMLVCTKNFTAFDCPRAFGCYAGTAPFEFTSGSSIKKRNRVSQIANKRIKAILYEAAWTASIWDPQIKAYYQRLLEKGKPKLLIINNIKNKLIARMFAVIKRQAPFVKLAH